jgi:Zn-dependent protease/predicted transcriptional regulator
VARDFQIMRLFGIPVRIHISWLVIFVLLVYTLARGYFSDRLPDSTPLTIWMVGTAATLLLFFSVLLHELSHSLVAKGFGLPVSGITLFLFGGVSQLSKEPDSPERELKMAAAGPAASLLLMITFLAILRLAGSSLPAPLQEIFFYLAVINGMLAAFNLLPGFPLDGGRILRALLWKRFGSLTKATKTAAAAGRALATFLVFMGIFIILTSDLFSGLWMVVIGLFLQQAAQGSYHQIMLKDSLQGLPVSQLMITDFVSVPPHETLTDMVENYIYRHHHDTFPVVEKGRLSGMVSVSHLKKVPRENWPATRVEDIMEKDTGALTVNPVQGVDSALKIMLQEGWGLLPVVDNSAVVGIISRGDIMHLIKIKSDLQA